MYVNTTALSDANCPNELSAGDSNSDYDYDPDWETCVKTDLTPGGCSVRFSNFKVLSML